MTESEAIKILQRDLQIQLENKALPDGIEAIQIAIQALEKQIAKKSKKSGVTDKQGIFHPINGINVCPSCEINLCTGGASGRDKKRMKYCENCGQKLDWSDKE